MPEIILLGSALMVATTFVHAACTVAAVRGVGRVCPDRWAHPWGWTRVALVSGVVVLMFLAALGQPSIWALTE